MAASAAPAPPGREAGATGRGGRASCSCKRVNGGRVWRERRNARRKPPRSKSRGWRGAQKLVRGPTEAIRQGERSEASRSVGRTRAESARIASAMARPRASNGFAVVFVRTCRNARKKPRANERPDLRTSARDDPTAARNFLHRHNEGV